MNIYQRPLFRQAGGPIAPEMGPMMPPQGMPPAPMAAPQMMPPQGLDPRAAEAVGQVEQGAAMQAEQYGQNMMAGLDAAETPEEVINAMRGNQRPLEARYGELAELVGQEDAQRTPETVLALLQPVMMMTEQGAMDSGIGELMGQLTGNIDMMDESGAPTEMGQGVGSLMMAGVGQQPVANFSQGGAVQRFQVGGEASRLQELYSEMLPVYQGVMGGGEDQRDLTKAQIFFDIADRFGAFAAGIDPRTGERMQGSAAAQFGAAASGLGGQIGERLGAQDQQERALRVAALQGAAGEFSAERADERAAARAAAAAAAGEKDRALGSLFNILDAEGNVVQQGVPIATQGQYAKIIEENPGIRIVPSRTAEAGFDTTTLYDPTTGAPTTFNTKTPEGLAAANAALAEGFTAQKPESGTLVERQQVAVTDQRTLDNLEKLSSQELSLFAANADAYIQETVSPSGVSSRRSLPPNTQAAMRRAHATGIDFPGIDPSLFGAPMRVEQVERIGLALLDTNNVDLGAATGLLSPLARTVNLLGEQVAEFVGGTGTVFTQTAQASSALNTLAAATRRFYIEGRTLAKEFEQLLQEIPTYSGVASDAATRRALTQQRNLLEGNLRRVEDVLENPERYTNKDISDARQLKTYADQLLVTYDEFIKAYSRLDGGGGTVLSYDDIIKNYSLGD